MRYVWWEEYLTLLGDWKCVPMEYGAECVTDSSTGVQTMSEWCVANWASQKTVIESFLLYIHQHCVWYRGICGG